VCGIEAEVFGVEAFATAPVTDGGGDKDSPAANGVEEVGVGGVGIHGGDWLVGGGLWFSGEK
jgi:hypothetical protein